MDENVEELFAFYALGALTEAERSQVEAYVASHPEAKARLEEMSRAASALPYDADPVEPPAALKKALMDRVNADARARFGSSRQIASPSRSRFVDFILPRAIAVFSLLIAIGLGVWAISLNNEVAHLRAETTSLRLELENQRTVITQLTSPQAQTFAISGTEHQPDAHGQFIADSRTGSAVLVVSGLNQLAAGSIYEFWLINDNGAVAAGLFRVDEQGQAILQVAQNYTPGTYNAIGVSIEPERGSAQPTGDIVMLGKVQ
jgi:anti-sigma-K factor RskA